MENHPAMTKENAIKLFEDKQIRSVWDEDAEKWYISIVDVVEVLTESPNPRKYWSLLKIRLKKEGSELATNCSQLKLQAADGKFYKSDVADVEQLSRLIQSIPSPKAIPPRKPKSTNLLPPIFCRTAVRQSARILPAGIAHVSREPNHIQIRTHAGRFSCCP